MLFIITDIQYDTDGEDIDLPTELEINVPMVVRGYELTELYISDKISELTGFCHKGFATTPKIPNK